MTTEHYKTKINVVYANDAGKYTFSKVRNDADDDSVIELMEGILKLQGQVGMNMYKIVQTKIEE